MRDYLSKQTICDKCGRDLDSEFNVCFQCLYLNALLEMVNCINSADTLVLIQKHYCSSCNKVIKALSTKDERTLDRIVNEMESEHEREKLQQLKADLKIEIKELKNYEQ